MACKRFLSINKDAIIGTHCIDVFYFFISQCPTHTHLRHTSGSVKISIIHICSYIHTLGTGLGQLKKVKVHQRRGRGRGFVAHPRRLVLDLVQ